MVPSVDGQELCGGAHQDPTAVLGSVSIGRAFNFSRFSSGGRGFHPPCTLRTSGSSLEVRASLRPVGRSPRLESENPVVNLEGAHALLEGGTVQLPQLEHHGPISTPQEEVREVGQARGKFFLAP